MNFKDIGDIAAWSEVDPEDTLAFDAPVWRKVRLTFNSEMHVSVFVSTREDREDAILLASSQGGIFETSFTTQATAYVYVVSAGRVFVTGHAPSHVVESVDHLVLTTLEPQGRRNTEYDRMLQLMRHNEKRRERQLQDEIAKVRRAINRGETSPKPRVKPSQKEPAADGESTDEQAQD